MKKEHQLQASFHQKMAEHHDKTSDHHGELSAHLQSTDPEASAAHADLQGCHKAIAAEHAAEAERHLECCKAASDELEKTDGGELLQEMRQLTKTLRDVVAPSGVSVIPQTDARQAVPRFGQRDPRSADARKTLDPLLKNVIVPEEQEPVAESVVRSGRTQF
jgi:succinylglutamate desuccinylase